MIESRIRYVILAWGSAAKTHIQKIQKLQDVALKIINDDAFKTLTVDAIIKMTTMIEYSEDNRFRQAIQHQLNTRRRAHGMRPIPRSYNNYGQRRLQNLVPTFINKIPSDIVSTVNFKKRKKLLKTFFLNV